MPGSLVSSRSKTEIEDPLLCILFCRERPLFIGQKMRSSANRRTIRRQNRRRGQIHFQSRAEPGRLEAGGHHLSHAQASSHRRAVGDLQLGGHALHGLRVHGRC